MNVLRLPSSGAMGAPRLTAAFEGTEELHPTEAKSASFVLILSCVAYIFPSLFQPDGRSGLIFWAGCRGPFN